MARQKLGQHFLSSPRHPGTNCRGGMPARQPLVIEIGPGRAPSPGICWHAPQRVVAIEIDPAHGRLSSPRPSPPSRAWKSSRPMPCRSISPAGDPRLSPAICRTTWPPRSWSASPGSARRLSHSEGSGRTRHCSPGIQGVRLLHRAHRLGRRKRTAVHGQARSLPPAAESGFRGDPSAPHPRAAGVGDRRPAEIPGLLSACFRQKRKNVRNNLTGMNLKQNMICCPKRGCAPSTVPWNNLPIFTAGLYDNPRR